MAAEKAAHFTTTFEAKPSIFEIVAQQSLNSTLHPALQRIAEFVVSFNPEKFDWLREYYDEIFLAVNGILQYHYIKHHAASFSEYFYGLQRTSTKSSSLSERDKRLSLLVLVIIPYLKRKLENRINYYKLQLAEGSLRNDFTGYIKQVFIFCHSAFSTTWGAWIFVNYLRYMANRAESQLPDLEVLNLKLVYATEREDNEGFWSMLLKGQLKWSDFRKGFLSSFVYSLLEVGAFTTQFLQVWNGEHGNYNINALPTPSPPKNDNDQFKTKCPICLKNWRIPTALPVSGYVFCFSCILRYLQENEKCPVTNLPARPQEIVRLYLSEMDY